LPFLSTKVDTTDSKYRSLFSFYSLLAAIDRESHGESELNIPLLHRNARPLQRAKAGLEIYEHTRRVLSSMNDLKSAFAEGAELSGGFRFGITRELGDLILTWDYAKHISSNILYRA